MSRVDHVVWKVKLRTVAREGGVVPDGADVTDDNSRDQTVLKATTCVTTVAQWRVDRGQTVLKATTCVTTVAQSRVERKRAGLNESDHSLSSGVQQLTRINTPHR